MSAFMLLEVPAVYLCTYNIIHIVNHTVPLMSSTQTNIIDLIP